MTDTDRRVAADDRWALVDKLLDDVDPALRKVFVLREIDEATIDATASVVDRPPSTVATQHSAARAQFDAALTRHRARERRTSRGAASALVPFGPALPLLERIRAWLGRPAGASRGGLALAAGNIFTVGALAGVLASAAHPPAPLPSTPTVAPILAAAPAAVNEEYIPAAVPTVLATAPTAAPATISPTASGTAWAEERSCLETARAKLAPSTLDPSAALRRLEMCEHRFPRRSFPEKYDEIRQQARAALGQVREKL